MNLQTFIHQHTLDIDRLTGGWILDVGCADFKLTTALLQYSKKILAVDPCQSVVDPGIEGIIYKRVAVVGNPSIKLAPFSDHNNECSHLNLKRAAQHGALVYTVECTDIPTLMQTHGIEQFDLVKLDCEGAEYDILLEWPGPIAKQINVEFHDWMGLNPCPREPDNYYRVMLRRLETWYTAVRTDLADSLYVLKT